MTTAPAAGCTVVLCTMFAFVAFSLPASFRFDEADVPAYTLPDPLELPGGMTVADANDWQQRRRPRILKLFEEHVYGRTPRRPPEMTFELADVDRQALHGRATRKQVTVRFGHRAGGPQMDILIYVPNNAPRPAPAFVGLNFLGNQSIHPDPGIKLSTRWIYPDTRDGIVDNRATERSRGVAASRWPVDLILARGYALATIYCGDLDPDFDDGFQNGVHPLFYEAGQRKPADDEWGTLGAWAWGLSRALDYLQSDDDIDAERVAVMGHSRLGKAALWAGAQDQRFALVIANNSGCGGAALSRRRFGETVRRINADFPYWFCGNFKKYNDQEQALPVDQHLLLALIAPRPVYVASANQDLWADPHGEFLSARHATVVYRLFGVEGLPEDKRPDLNEPLMGTIGYHLRSGKHDVTRFDWRHFLDFADRHLRRKS